MANEESEELEQQDKQEQKENNKEKRKQTLKTVVISVICTLLFVILLLLFVILCLKNCSAKGNNEQTSSSQPIDTERNNKITDVFLDIVNKQMTFDGYDADELTSVVAVTYEDNYPTNFNLNIIVNSDSKVYYYYASDVNYPDDKSGYDDFVSYLLMNTTDHVLNGDITLSLLEKTNEVINTSKTSYKAIISKSASNDKYLSGFYYENNNFFIYQKRLIVEGEDSFAGVGDQKIDSMSPLYDYYRGLLTA